MWDISKLTTWVKLLSGLVAGVICWLVIAFTPPDKLPDFVAVVIVLLVEAVVIMIIDGGHIADSAQQNAQFLKDIVQRNSDFMIKIDELATHQYSVRAYDHRDLDPSEVPKVWIELLTNCKESYRGTSYLKTKDVSAQQEWWLEAALAIQKAKKLSDPDIFSIKKVFIIDDESELALLGPHLKAQREVGIECEHLSRNQIDSDPTLASREKDLPSLDFAIFDRDLVLVWELKDRALRKGYVFFGTASVALHEEFFHALYLRARSDRQSKALLGPAPSHPVGGVQPSTK